MRSTEQLTAEQRLAEIARILAAGILRLKQASAPSDSRRPALDDCSKTVLSVPRG